MREELWECRFYFAAIAVLVALCVGGIMDGAHRRADFYRDHHCRDLTNGYVCADGAVLE